MDQSRLWYVIYTRPQAEDLARSHLERQRYTVYLPVFRRRITHARKVSWRQSALFPRYLFVNLDLERENWRPVLSTVGVSGAVMRGDRPAPLQDRVIEAIRAREGEDGSISLPEAPVIASGTPVRIEDGPFRDSVGLFSGMADEERVHVLLKLLGRDVRVSVPATLVRKLA